MTDHLTEKQRRFAEALIGEAKGNATEAARLAGYGGDDATLANIGHENVRKREIVAEIERLRAERENQPGQRKKVADRAEREAFFTAVLRGEIPDVAVDKDGNAVEVPADLTVRADAGKTLGKMQGDFIKRVEQTERPAYDLSKLTKEEREAWIRLMDKAKTKPAD